jgi:tRNA-Thr(GGU) m(6)t(6)A37 methyltransferase TsaA
MVAETRELVLRPIGWVVRGPACPPEDGWEERVAEVEVDAAWAGALDGIDEFSHVWLIWWLDRMDEPPATMHVHPERREELPEVGIFATRSPHRPNPLALTVVELLERQGRRLRVRGLDACQGTPILDIKPYLRRGDLIPEATVSDWLETLWTIHDQERKEANA